MKSFLIVVDMQKDFVDGSLGTKEAQAIVGNVVNKIAAFDGEIIVTYDTHESNYLQTAEGKKLPIPHCIRHTDGWTLDDRIQRVLDKKAHIAVEKPTFGSVQLPLIVREAAGGEVFCAEFVGLCTDICVVSNALLLKSHFPEATISVDAACCAGVTPQSHEAALTTMQMCQIDIKR